MKTVQFFYIEIVDYIHTYISVYYTKIIVYSSIGYKRIIKIFGQS